MKLELKDMKIAKVDLSENNYEYHDAVESCVENVVNILNPTTFALIIKRNLSAGWYKEIPELYVSGRLKSIEINLMAIDYQLLMSILAKNMTEGADEWPVVTAAPMPKRPEIGMYNTYTKGFPHFRLFGVFDFNLFGVCRISCFVMIFLFYQFLVLNFFISPHK